MTLTTGQRRAAIILLGYLAAFGVACAVLTLYVAATNTPDRQTSQGMYAFGDTVVFLGALALASLPASAAVLFFLRGNSRFWTVLATISLGVATTGIAAALVYSVPYDRSRSWLQTLSMLSPLRVIAAPLFAMAFLLSGVIAPSRPPRTALFIATAAEAITFTAVAVRWFLALH